MGDQRLSSEAIEANLGDLDYAIFAALPDEEAKLGYHPLFKSAKHLLGELNAPLAAGVPPIKMGELNGRLRSLAVAGLAAPISKSLSGRVDGWQRTAKAKG